MTDEWKRERNERALRDHLRKTADAAHKRMRERTAREQFLAAQAELNREQDDSIHDADNASLRNIMR